MCQPSVQRSSAFLQSYQSLRAGGVDKAELQQLASQAASDGSIDAIERDVFKDIVKSQGALAKDELAALPAEVQSLFAELGEKQSDVSALREQVKTSLAELSQPDKAEAAAAKLAGLSEEQLGEVLLDQPALIQDFVQGLHKLSRDSALDDGYLKRFQAAKVIARKLDAAIQNTTCNLYGRDFARMQAKAPLTPGEERAYALARACLAATGHPLAGQLPAAPRDAAELAKAAVKYNSERSGHMIQTSTLNSTPTISASNKPADTKAALAKVFQMVKAVRPDIAERLQTYLNNDDYPIKASEERFGEWNTILQDMVLYDGFWKMNDDEKATVLIHEYTHAQSEQNPRRQANKLFSIFGAGRNHMEYLAYVNQKAAALALGVDAQDSVWPIIHETEQYKFTLPENPVQLLKDIDSEGLWTADGELQAMRSTAKVLNLNQKAEFINYLLDQNPTSAAQESLILSILQDTPPADQKALLRRLDRPRLREELENPTERASFDALVKRAGL